MKRPAGTLLVAAVAVVVTGVPSASFASHGGDGDVTGDGNGIDVTWTEGHGNTGSGEDPVYTVPGPWTEYRYVPTCDANKPEGGADALCMAAVSTCPDDLEIRYWVFSRTRYPDGREPTDWERIRTECRGPGQVSDGQPVITQQMVTDAARQAAPRPAVHVEPSARTFVNVPTNVYAETEPQVINVELVGVQVPITFTPTSYTWSFGDGGTRTGAGIAQARVGQTGAVEYEYRRRGKYGITLTRGYQVSVVFPDGSTVTLTEPITATSEPYNLPVGEIQTVVTKVR